MSSCAGVGGGSNCRRDATLDENLREARIVKAQGLLSCLSADTDNVFVCLSARDLNPDLTIVARAPEEGSVENLYRAGADNVVSPNVSGAIRMASMLLRPRGRFLPRPRDPVGRSGAALRASRRPVGLLTSRANPHRCAHPSGNGTDRHRGEETDRRDA